VATGEIEAFGWVRSTMVLRDAACVTLVAPADAGRVVRGFGGDIAGARRASLADIGMPSPAEPVVAVRDLGSWLLVVEVNGWTRRSYRTMSSPAWLASPEVIAGYLPRERLACLT
jgi:hypothetical protein